MYPSYKDFDAAKAACRACPIGLVYNRVVCSDGCRNNPSVMVIGEAPGRDEVIDGRPFVGKSGRLLRDVLNRCGFNTRNAIITNVMPCRPPDNKFPSDEQIVKACAERWLFEEIALLKPQYVLLVGSKAMKFILGLDGITSRRGQWFEATVRGHTFKCLPTLHPSYVLRLEYTDEGDNVREAFKADIGEVARAAGFTPPPCPAPASPA